MSDLESQFYPADEPLFSALRAQLEESNSFKRKIYAAERQATKTSFAKFLVELVRLQADRGPTRFHSLPSPEEHINVAIGRLPNHVTFCTSDTHRVSITRASNLSHGRLFTVADTIVSMSNLSVTVQEAEFSFPMSVRTYDAPECTPPLVLPSGESGYALNESEGYALFKPPSLHRITPVEQLQYGREVVDDLNGLLGRLSLEVTAEYASPEED